MAAHLEKLMRLYNRLKRGPVTIEIIAKWAKGAGIEVSERQLYRDLEQLKQLKINDGEGIVEFVDEKNKKTWKLEFKEASYKITTYDINSFYLLKNFAPAAILNERKDSIEKFETVLFKSLSNNKFQQYIQANELYLQKSNYNENMYGLIEHQQMEDLIWALHNSKKIIVEKDFINTSNINVAENDFPITIAPIELIFTRGRVCIGGISNDGKVFFFTIDKQLQFKLTNEKFSRKKLYPSYKKYCDTLYSYSTPIGNKVHNIKIEFTDSYGESMRSFFWHNSAIWTLLKNGNYVLSLKCTISRDLVGFVAIGLNKVKVHQPQVLKNLVLKKLQDTISLYLDDLEVDEKVGNEGY